MKIFFLFLIIGVSNKCFSQQNYVIEDLHFSFSYFDNDTLVERCDDSLELKIFKKDKTSFSISFIEKGKFRENRIYVITKKYKFIVHKTAYNTTRKKGIYTRKVKYCLLRYQ